MIGDAAPYIAPNGKKYRRALCICECGHEVSVMVKKLRSGHTRSCGCLQRESRTKHGHNTGQKSPTYQTWDAMIQRCYNEKSTKFYLYGSRGISVCDRWRSSFSDFLEDMGERPLGKTIDRLDGNGNYEPGNCRWATRKEQQRNLRSNQFITIAGRRVTIPEASELTGIHRETIRGRLRRGLSDEEAVRCVS